MPATLRFNPDKSQVEAELSDGSVFLEDWPDDGLLIMTTDGEPHLAALEGNVAGLDPNQIYKLVPVVTAIETDVDLDAEDDDDEDEADEAETVETN